jgi:hypothetical protein
MTTSQVVSQVILPTSLGAVQTTVTTVTGFDIETVVTLRTQDFATKLLMTFLGQNSDPLNNVNSVFPSTYIGS